MRVGLRPADVINWVFPSTEGRQASAFSVQLIITVRTFAAEPQRRLSAVRQFDRPPQSAEIRDTPLQMRLEFTAVWLLETDATVRASVLGRCVPYSRDAPVNAPT